MQTIWKFRLVAGDNDIQMPRGSKALHVGVQRECLCLWAKVDDEQPEEARRFYVTGTGWPLNAALTGKYIGTVQIHNSTTVLHAFEI